MRHETEMFGKGISLLKKNKQLEAKIELPVTSQTTTTKTFF